MVHTAYCTHTEMMLRKVYQFDRCVRVAVLSHHNLSQSSRPKKGVNEPLLSIIKIDPFGPAYFEIMSIAYAYKTHNLIIGKWLISSKRRTPPNGALLSPHWQYCIILLLCIFLHFTKKKLFVLFLSNKNDELQTMMIIKFYFSISYTTLCVCLHTVQCMLYKCTHKMKRYSFSHIANMMMKFIAFVRIKMEFISI